MRPSVLMNHTVRDREIYLHTHTHGHSHCADPASLSLIISHKCITAAVQTLKQANYDARTFTLGARTGTSAAASGVILQQLRHTGEYVGCKFVTQTSTLAHNVWKNLLGFLSAFNYRKLLSGFHCQAHNKETLYQMISIPASSWPPCLTWSSF